MKKTLGLFALAFGTLAASAPAFAADAKIVLVAGKPSHGPGEHEFNAGILLLEKCLKQVHGVDPVVVKGGWPADESVFDGAKSIVFFMDGGGGHPVIQSNHLEVLRKQIDKGVGLVCLHYAVEFPKEHATPILDWLGGYYETGYSTNPHNDITVTPAASHPISSGVKPFQANDEWYYKIRFRDNDKRVTPVLTGILPKGSSNNETLGWAVERENGGRAFGFTGGHNHTNWGNADFRKLVLNGILWTAKVDIPAGGVETEVSKEDLAKNLDPKPARK
ncbi:ThuA domain-containing protein [Isosphaeraceae bacterium EP7]